MTVQDHIDMLLRAVPDPDHRKLAELVFEYQDDCFGPQIVDRVSVKQVALDVVTVKVEP